MKESPFIFEDAVPVDKFFNRKEELEFFIRQLESGKRKFLICIVGPLKFGKTSLMLKYLDIVKQYDDIIPIYVDLKKKRSPIAFLAKNLAGLLGKNVLEKYREAKKEDDLDILFEEIDGELRKRNKWLFIFFDEFQLLPDLIRAEGFMKEMPSERIFGFFRGYAEGRRISYIVCGSVIEELYKAIDVWGGRFQIIYLGPFPKEDAIFMLKKLFGETSMDVPGEVIEEIAESAAFHPFYMQYMGNVIYSLGRFDRQAIIEAKKRLWGFLRPIFMAYIDRMLDRGEELLMTFIKILRGEEISLGEVKAEYQLYRMGFIRPKDSYYEPIDPLFARFVEAFLMTRRPPEVVIVGHWAERVVGNYLLRKGYYPYYSHDSRGAFDIYVKVKGYDVGIQVKYSSYGRVNLSREEAKKILATAREMKWIPIIALVSKNIEFFWEVREGKYKEGDGVKDIEKAVEKAVKIAGYG